MLALRILGQQRNLIWQLSLRDIQSRYRGSSLGMIWAVLQPLLMLAVYAMVFTQIFKAKWGTSVGGDGSQLDFALQLFAGLICFAIFSDCMIRAPGLITSNPSYVTKVVFPLEALGVAAVAGAVFQASTSLVVLLLFELFGKGRAPLTLVLTPVVWIPLVLSCLALTWLGSALGVYLRDLGQLMGVAVNLLMYLTPIFYPISAAPSLLQHLLLLNPLTLVVQQTRSVAVDGMMPSWQYLLIGSLVGLLACELGLRVFVKAKRGFADVL